jgi:hypothetical protein
MAVNRRASLAVETPTTRQDEVTYRNIMISMGSAILLETSLLGINRLTSGLFYFRKTSAGG